MPFLSPRLCDVRPTQWPACGTATPHCPFSSQNNPISVMTPTVTVMTQSERNGVMRPWASPRSRRSPAVPVVLGTEALGHRQPGRAAEEFLPRVAEEGLGLRVDESDGACVVHDDHRLRGGLHQARNHSPPQGAAAASATELAQETIASPSETVVIGLQRVPAAVPRVLDGDIRPGGPRPPGRVIALCAVQRPEGHELTVAFGQPAQDVLAGAGGPAAGEPRLTLAGALVCATSCI